MESDGSPAGLQKRRKRKMKSKMKKALTIVLAAMVLFSAQSFLFAQTAMADTNKLSEEEIVSKLNAVYKDYPAGDKWYGPYNGAYQCYGFGKLIINKLFGKTGKSVRTWRYDGTGLVGMKKIGGLDKLTKDNVKWLLLYAQPGDVLQFKAYKDNGHQHTMIVWDVDETGVTIYHNNWTKDTIRKDYKTWKEFAAMQYDSKGNQKRGALSLLRADNAGNYSDSYTVYPTHGTVQVKKEAALKTLACNAKTNKRSYTYATLQPGTKIEVIQLVKNDRGNYWYEAQYNGKTKLYIYSAYVNWIDWASSDITVSGVSVPSGKVNAGKDVTIKAEISAKYNRMISIEGYIKTSNGKTVASESAVLNDVASVSIQKTDLKTLNVSRVKACGTYNYIVLVHCRYWIANNNKLQQKIFNSYSVINKSFTVK